MTLGEEVVRYLSAGCAGETVAFTQGYYHTRFDVVRANGLACTFRGFQMSRTKGDVFDDERRRRWAGLLAERIPPCLNFVQELVIGESEVPGALSLYSSPTDQYRGACSYYRITLHPSGLLTLACFRRSMNAPGSHVATCAFTAETFQRLIDEFVAACALSRKTST